MNEEDFEHLRNSLADSIRIQQKFLGSYQSNVVEDTINNKFRDSQIAKLTQATEDQFYRINELEKQLENQSNRVVELERNLAELNIDEIQE